MFLVFLKTFYENIFIIRFVLIRCRLKSSKGSVENQEEYFSNSKIISTNADLLSTITSSSSSSTSKDSSIKKISLNLSKPTTISSCSKNLTSSLANSTRVATRKFFYKDSKKHMRASMRMTIL